MQQYNHDRPPPGTRHEVSRRAVHTLIPGVPAP
jgi:hypothetical protein